ncbi:MAG: serine acetyltransferase [Desemzia incerta]|uniref:serine O-acetyltransferase n=1 Tax=Desemzia incerta TaxID=82801 RepID=UPI003314D285
MSVSLNNKIIILIKNVLQHYNHEKYWKMRETVINPNSKTTVAYRLFYLYRIKKMDAFNNASMGCFLGEGASFLTPPKLPHGLNGIIVHPRAKIGKNCTIHQQVTIGNAVEGGEAPIIGDNCYIGAGAKIIGEIIIGSNVTVGANAVVTKDIPDNCVCGGVPAKIIEKSE